MSACRLISFPNLRFAFLALSICLLLVLPTRSWSQSHRWSLLAGDTGGAGYVDGPAGNSRLQYAQGVVADGLGNLFVADSENAVIRKVSSSGQVTTFAGRFGRKEIVDGTRSNAGFSYPRRLARDASGNLYVSDQNAIRKITPGGVVSTLAGHATLSGTVDGMGGAARFSGPIGLTVDSAGIVYVADTNSHTIRKIALDGKVTTYAGQAGAPGSTNAVGTAARFVWPYDVAFDADGNLWIADGGNNLIRKMSPGGEVSTVAGTANQAGLTDGTGTAARFYRPRGLVRDGNGDFLVADYLNNVIRKVTPAGEVTTFAGTYTAGNSTDGLGLSARMAGPSGLAIDGDGNFYVASQLDHTIRKITPWALVSTVAGRFQREGTADGTGSAAQFTQPYSVAVDQNKNAYVPDRSSHTLRKITPQGVVTTVAGLAGTSGSADGLGAQARFSFPSGIAINAAGDIYVTSGHSIRKVTPAGQVTIFAGHATQTGSTDAVGTGARFNSPGGLVFDTGGNLYVSESVNNLIRKIAPDGTVTTVAGQALVSGSANGVGTAAQFHTPLGLAIDSSGNLFVADRDNHTIRKVTPAGEVTTLAGLAETSGQTDGTGNQARLNLPRGVVVGDGVLYVSDSGNHALRSVSFDGVVKTIAGSASTLGHQEGIAPSARFLTPSGLAIDADGTLYVAGNGNANVVIGTRIPDVQIEQPEGTDLAGAPTVNWGSVPSTTAGETRTMTVRNNGLAVLNNLAVTIDTQEVENFKVTTPLGITALQPGEITTFIVTYLPLAVGEHAATLHLSSDDPNELTVPIQLAGSSYDTTPPAITSLPEDFSVEATGPAGALVTYTLPTATDNVEVTSLTSLPASGGTFPLGITKVEVQAKDAAGNIRKASFKITVQDTTPPNVTVAPLQLKANPSTRTLALPDLRSRVRATDSVGLAPLAHRTQSPAPGTGLALGAHVVTLGIRDLAGNLTTVELPIKVLLDVSAYPSVVSAVTGATVTATEGLDAPATISSFGVPAVSDAGDLLAKATLKSGRTTLAAIYRENAEGEGAIVAFQGQTLDSPSGATFKSFGDPISAPDGTLAFAAKLQGAGAVTTSTDDSVWTNALGGGLRMVLREGTEILPNLKVKAISSLSLRDGELLALVTLATKPGHVATTGDTIVLQLTAAGPEILLREGVGITAGIPATTSPVKTISILGPALGSAGHGRWQADGGAVAKVTLADGRTVILRLAAGANPEPILTTKDSALDEGLPSKWAKFGLPAVSGAGTSYAVHGTLQALKGEVINSNDTALLYSTGGDEFTTLVQEKDPSDLGDWVVFSSFLDPVVNAEGEALFLGTVKGPGVGTKTYLWRGFPGELSRVAGITGQATDAEGVQSSTQTWSGILSYALPDAGGPLFLAKLAGKGLNSTNNLGLWREDASGKVRRMIGIGDEIVAGNEPGSPIKKIKTLSLLNAPAGVFGATRSFNQQGSVALLVTFTDKSQALLRLDLPPVVAPD